MKFLSPRQACVLVFCLLGLAPALARGQSITIDDVSVAEGDTPTTINAGFTVTLFPPNPTQTVTVQYQTAAGTATGSGADFNNKSLTTLSFAPNETMKTVNVTVNGDNKDEDDETFFLNLSNPVNATLGDTQGIGTILDDDPLPSVSLNDVSVSEGNSGTITASFTVTLAPASGRTVTVQYQTANNSATAPSDYTAKTLATLTWNTGGALTKQVNVTVKGDTFAEPSETFLLNLSGATNATLSDSQGIGTITNDDAAPASLSIDDVTLSEGNAGTTTAGFTVTLTPAATQTVTVHYQTANGTAEEPEDYLAASATLTFTVGETSKPVSVTVNGDVETEDAETFFVDLDAATNAAIGDGNGVGTITNDDVLWAETPIFGTTTPIPDIEGPAGYVAGDLNGDGRLDLVAAGTDEGNCRLLVLLQDISGNYPSVSQEPMVGVGEGLCGTGSGDPLTLGDVDADGDLDLVAVGQDCCGTRALRLFRNDGAGSFDGGTWIMADLWSGSVALGDVDADGDLDLAASGRFGTDPDEERFIVFRNDGGGNFSQVQEPFGAGSGYEDGSVAFADLDSDGDLDLLVSGATSDGPGLALDVFRNDGGTFTLDLAAIPSGYRTNQGLFRLADTDLDGDLDLVFARSFGPPLDILHFANVGGSFQAPTTVATLSPGSWYGLALGDVNGDGYPDLFVNGNDTTTQQLLYFENQAGTFVQGNAPAATFTGPVLFGDFDGDNDLDMVGLPVRVLYENLPGPANAAPGPPTGLAASPAADGVQLSWLAPTDPETPSAALSYEVRLGTAPDTYDVISGVYGSPLMGTHPLGRIAPSLPGRRLVLPSGTYFWRVCAMDTGLRQGACSAESSFASNQVSNTSDSGPGSLRDAINLANNDGGPSFIAFSPSLAGQTIVLSSPLPGLSENGTTLDADFNGDCVPDVEIDGASAGPGSGLDVFSADNVIRGLRIVRFANDGINVSGPTGNVVECNVIGTDLSGTADFGNASSGVAIRSGASDNRVGPGNVIAFNGGHAVLVSDGTLPGVFPDFTGFTPDDTDTYPLIDFRTPPPFQSTDGIIPTHSGGQFFANNFGARFTGSIEVGMDGTYTFDVPETDDRVRILVDGNLILDASCCAPAQATYPLTTGAPHGIEIDYLENNGAAGFAVQISGPGFVSLTTGGQPGLLGEFFLLREPSEGNQITQNSIFANDVLGIGLDSFDNGPNGQTPNDPGDADIGPNTVLNFPEFTSVTDNGGGSFSVDGTAPPGSTVELFANPAGALTGEGKLYLASAAADGTGNFAATVTVPGGFETLSATATDALGNTSEFSGNEPLIVARWGSRSVFSGIPDIGGPAGHVAGDLNGDGRLDLVAAGSDGPNCRLLVLLQDASGNYPSVSQEPMGAGQGLCETHEALALGDVDADGDLDLVAQGKDGSGTRRLLRFLNGGSGSFDGGTDIGTGLSNGAVALGDLDGDGDLDLLAAGEESPTTIHFFVFVNDGSGAFTPGQEPEGANKGFSDGPGFALGDVDNDGDLDVLASGNATVPLGGRHLYVYRNASGVLSRDQSLIFGTEGLNGASLRLADTDLDGDLDLIAIGNNNDGGERSRLVHVENLGSSFSTSFTTLMELGPTGGWAGLAVGDVNGDGYPDLFANGNDGGNRLFYFENQAGVLVEADQPAVSFTGPVLFGDFDGDADLDMVGLPVRHLYVNELGPANAAPSAPTGLSADLSGPMPVLTWNAASDAESGSDALSYEVRLGLSPGTYDVISGAYGSPLMGTHPLNRTAPGQPGRRIALASGTYYWRACAIDTGLVQGPCSAESSFVWVAPPALSVDDVSVSESGGTATFTVTLTNGMGAGVDVDYCTADGGATAGSDYTTTCGMLTFSGPTTSLPIVVPILQDALDEFAETFTVALSNATGGALIVDGSGLGTITDDDPLPTTLSISSASIPEGDSGDRTLFFTLSLSELSGRDVSVTVNTANGSASAGTDYDALSNFTATVPAGLTGAVVAVTVHGDTAIEGDETFTVSLSNAPNVANFGTSQATGTILEDEQYADPPVDGNWILAEEGMTTMLGSAFGAGTYVLVGQQGEIWTSPDGSAWARQANPDSQRRGLNAATFGGGQFVAVGNGGAILTSPEAVTWTLQIPPVVGNFIGVVHSGSLYVLVGNNGRILTSPDGVTWTQQTSGTTQVLRGVAFGGGVFVAVGNNRTALRSSDGVNWSAQSVPAGLPSQLMSVTHTGTQFVAVSLDPAVDLVDDGGVMTSPDGVAWAQQSIAATSPLRSVAAGGGHIVATGIVDLASETPFFHSLDGIAWAPVARPGTAGSAYGLRTVAYGASGFVASGPQGTVYQSADGTAWTTRTLAQSRGWGGVAHNGTFYCAVASFGVTATSPDGATWTQTATGLDAGSRDTWADVVYVGGQFVAVGDLGAVMTSPNCVNWTLQRFPEGLPPFSNLAGTGFLFRVAHGNGLFVAVGERYPQSDLSVIEPLILTSPDGVDWTERASNIPPAQQRTMPSVAFGNGRFAALGYDNFTGELFLSTSEDGTNWTLRPVPFEFDEIGALEYAGGQFLAVGGRIWTSPDGLAWTLRRDYGAGLGAVSYGNGRYVAVGFGGATEVSVDGIVWTPDTNATFHNLGRVAFGAGRFVAVGTSAITYTDFGPLLWVNDVSVTEGNLGSVNATFTVTLSPASIGTVTVQYATVPETATGNGNDYGNKSGTLTFNPGQTTKTVNVSVKGDTKDEPDETFLFQLSSPSGASILKHGRGTILDDDATPTLSVGNASVTEGNSGTKTASFGVALSAASGQAVTVNYATADDTATAPEDYTAKSGTLTFNPGQITKNVAVTAKGDTFPEASEVFHLDLSAPSNATLADGQGDGTITNDDGTPVSVSIGDVAVAEGTVAGETARWDMTQSSGGMLLDDIGGKQMTLVNGASQVSPGRYGPHALLLVNPLPLNVVARQMGTVANAGNGADLEDVGTFCLGYKPDSFDYVGGAASMLSGFKDGSGYNQGGWILNHNLGGYLWQQWKPGFTDYVVHSWNGAEPTVGVWQHVCIVRDGTLVDLYLDGALYPGGKTDHPAGYAASANTLLVVGTDTIDEHPTPGQLDELRFFQGRALSGSEILAVYNNSGIANASFTVTVSAAPPQDVIIDYATADSSAVAGPDYSSASGSLTFPAGSTVPQAVSVLVYDDSLDEGDETFAVNLSRPRNATIADGQGIATILDDDVAGVPHIDSVSPTATAPGGPDLTLNLRGANFAPSSLARRNGLDLTTVYQGPDRLLTSIPAADLATPHTTALNVVNPEDGGGISEPAFLPVSQPGASVSYARTPVDLTVGAQPEAIVAADLNGDGFLDLATANENVSTIAVFLGNGDGSFGARTDYAGGPPGGGLLDLRAGDLNGDGALELVFAHSSAPLAILPGNGDGSLGAPAFIGDSLSPASVALGDVNRDGRLDVVTVNGTSTNLSIHLGNGDLSFAPRQDLVLAAPAFAVAVGDLNGDGKLDLAALLLEDIDVFLGDGDGSFGPRLDSVIGIESNTFELGDLNGDGILDATITGGAKVALGNGDGTFAQPPNGPAPIGGNPQRLALGDLNSDGNLDAAAAQFLGGVPDPGALAVALGDGAGDFGPVSSFGAGVESYQPVIGDFDGDGRLDVALANIAGETVSVFRFDQPPSVDSFTATPNIGQPPLGVTLDVQASDPDGVIVEYRFDFDGDGLDDLITSESSLTHTYAAVGEFNARVTVVDGLGLTATATRPIDTDVVPTLVINDVSVNEGDAGTTTATFTVTLQFGTGPATVDFVTANGGCGGFASNASAGSDYVAASGSVALSPGTPTQPIAITVNGDILGEANECFTVNLFNASGATIGDFSGRGTILNDDAGPTISIGDGSSAEGQAGTRSMLFPVSLSSGTHLTVSVSYQTADNSANALDYVGIPSTPLSFAPGETVKLVSVTIYGDTDPEGDESFFVNLSGETGASLADGQAAGTIADDEDVAPEADTTGWNVAQEGIPSIFGSATNGSIYVLVGQSGNIWTSPDAVAWTRRANPDATHARLNAVFWGGPGGSEQFVAVGNCCAADGGSLVLTSPDGIDWTQQSTAPIQASLNAVTFGNGLYAVAANGGRVLTSPNGVDWTARNTGAGRTFRGVAYGNGVFVAVGDFATVVRSDDGITWEIRSLPAGGESRLNAVTFTGAQFVAVAQDPVFSVNTGASVYTSPDGMAWTLRSVPTDQALLSVASGGGVIVAVSIPDFASPVIEPVITSTDGINWTRRAVEDVRGVSTLLNSVVFGPGGFLAVGRHGAVYTSADGTTTWTSRTLTTSRHFFDVAHDGTRYCAVGERGMVAHSTDGLAWTPAAVAPDQIVYPRWNAITHANGLFVAVGISSTVMTSTDCDTWTVQHPDTPPPLGLAASNLLDVTFGEGLFVAVGESYPTGVSIEGIEPIILTSPNGVDWTPATPAVPAGARRGFESIEYGNGRFVAFAEDRNTIDIFLTTSEDGINWTLRPTPFDRNLPEDVNKMAFGEGRFVVVSDRIRHSTDGINWTIAIDYPANDYFLNVAHGGGRFVAVGIFGGTYVSTDGQVWTPNTPATTHDLYAIAHAAALDRFVAVGLSTIVYGDFPTNTLTVTKTGAGIGTVASDVAGIDCGASCSADYDPVASVTLTPTPGVDSTFAGWSGASCSPTICTVTMDQPRNVTATFDSLLPTFVINDVTVAEGNAGTTTASFTVTLQNPAGPVTADFITANGSARAGSDYVATAGTLTLSSSTPSALVNVTVNGDTQGEANETFSVQLGNASPGALIGDFSGLGAINNDDAAPTISISDAEIAEDQSGQRVVSLVVALSGGTHQTVTVNFDTGDGSATDLDDDYEPASGTLTFDPGTLTQTVAVTVNGDTTSEGDESFFVNLSNASVTILDGQGVATILDDEGQAPKNQTTAWTLAQEGMTLNAGASDGTRYVLVGNGGDIWTSTDTINWTKEANPDTTGAALRAVTFANGQFVAVGNCCATDGGSVVLTSPDGQLWTLRSAAPIARPLFAIAYGNGSYVAAANGGRVITSPDGIAWTEQNTGTGTNFTGVAFGGGVFVAVAPLRGVFTSTDGIAWTRRSVPSTVLSRLQAVTHTGTQFVAVARDPSNAIDSGGSILTSPDGVTWTQQAVAATQGLFGVGAGGGLTVAVGTTDGTATFNNIFTSPDGITWTVRSHADAGPGVSPGLGFVFNGPAGLVTGGGRGQLYASADGITWPSRTLSTSRWPLVVAHDGIRYCAVGVNAIVMSSTDGAAWTNVNTGIDHNSLYHWLSMAHANGLFVAVGKDTSVMTSPDCQSWTLQRPSVVPPPSEAVSFLNDVAFGEGLFVAVGEEYPTGEFAQQVNPIILTSNDAITWTPVTPAVPASARRTFVSVSYGAGRFVAYAMDLDTFEMFLSTSENGVTWTPQPAPFFDVFETVTDTTFGSGRFVAVGDRIRTSTDGINWTLALDYPESGDFFNGVGHGEGRFVAVGSRGTTYVSTDGTSWAANVPATTHDLFGVGYSDTANRFVLVGQSAMVRGDFPTQVLTVAKAGSANGIVTSDVEGIDCGGTCSAEYDAGVSVTLTATPTGGSVFTGWSGACAGTGSCVVTMDSAKAVTASFSIGISITDVSVVEQNTGTNPLANFTISLSSAAAANVTVQYATAAGTATGGGTDYGNKSLTTLTFLPGETSKVVGVTVKGDDKDEDDETFFLNLSNPSVNAVLVDSQGVGTILDDDPLPSLTISDVTLAEGTGSGNTSFNFTVTLAPVSGRSVTVDYQTANGTAIEPGDYTPKPLTTLTFTAGQASKTVTVSVKKDAVNETNETFFVNLSGATNAVITDSQGVGTITNDDP